jgi:hypothetical protein
MSYNKLGFVSGQTLKAEHLNHMEDGIANAGGVKSWNDLEDKPFYEETKVATFEFESFESEEVFLDGAKVFAVGDTVTVEVDGVEHSLVAFDDDGYATIGDTYDDLASDSGSYGWQLYVDEHDVYADFHNDGKHTVSLVTKVVHQLDEKYLPAVGATKFYFVVNEGDNYLHTSADSSEETRAHSKDIDAAVSRGTIVVYAVFDNGNIDSIMYPHCIFHGASGYWISADNGNGTQFGFKTSDYTSNVE